MNNTSGNETGNGNGNNVRPTIPVSQLTQVLRYYSESSTNDMSYTNSNTVDLPINQLSNLSSVQISIPNVQPPNDTPVPPLSSTNERDLIAFVLIFFGIAVLQTVILAEISRPQQDLQLEMSHNIVEGRREFHEFLTSTFPNIFQAVLGVPQEVQQGAREELQYIHRSIQNLQDLPQDFVQLSFDLREAIQAQFTEMFGTVEKGLQRGFDQVTDDLNKYQAEFRQTWAQDGVPPLSRANTPEAGDQDIFWRETWTEMKDDFKRTVEGFNRNLLMLNVVIDAFHDQFQRLPTMMADELTRAFKAEIKKYEIDIKIENANSSAAVDTDRLASLASNSRTNGTEMDLQESPENPIVSGHRVQEVETGPEGSPELPRSEPQGLPSDEPEFEHSEFVLSNAVDAGLQVDGAE
ncbi:uncharacterized protein N7503_003095 [Penicillium pulvis]|uniref:uncharacterized protein n=1 Tax=Penicillium pulvis TaxID=1562058 RepID=UPI0025466663|nr:uncharacterized protein N7503_003095 [Penicillium pulvis]KAJ5805493.1 hypothetical protein N7503_003095 [Penicillium pulvis]